MVAQGVVGDGSLLLDYTYKTDIDEHTYNSVKLVRPNEATGRGEVFQAVDSANIARWGLLQHYQSVDEALNDAQAAAGIWERMAHRDACVVLAGKHDLCQSFALIRDASFVFGNDTGAIHMAAVCRVPAAAIVVGREIGRFFPYEVERRTGDEIFPEAIFAPLPCMGCMLKEERPCVYAQDGQERLPCIEQISVGQVQAAIQRFL